jgi:tRNA-Thr(GGU) m(6)t(6)A37 methyltransferase TsaA
MKIELEPVAYVSAARKEATDDNWGDAVSVITLADGFTEETLRGIEDYSHLEIVFYFDKADPQNTNRSSRHPRGNKNWPLTGVFAHRGKDRPNHIGLTFVTLLKKEGRTLTVKGLDAIDGTPVLDIKPVMKEFLPSGALRQPEWSKELMKNYW